MNASTVNSIFWCAFDSGVQVPHQYSGFQGPVYLPGCPHYSIYHPWMILGPPKDSQSPSSSAYTKDYPNTSQVFRTPWDIRGQLVAVLDIPQKLKDAGI